MMIVTTNRNINDIIVDKIHTTFIELVPEDELREIVAASIDAFKMPTYVVTNTYNGTKEKRPSPLDQIVGDAVNKMLSAAVEKHLDKILKPSVDEHGQRIASEALTKAVEGAAPLIMKSMINQAAEHAAMNMLGHFRSDLRSRGLNV